MAWPSLPVFDDPVSFVTSLLSFVTLLIAALDPSAAFATLIYNVLFKWFNGLNKKAAQAAFPSASTEMGE